MAKLLVFGKLQCLLVRHFSLFFHVAKIADQVNDDRRCRVVADLSEPLILNIFKARAVGDIEYEEDSITTLVKVSGDRSETFLSGRIPDLKFDVGLFSHDHTKVAELDANGHSVLLFESLSGQSFQNACFSNTSVTQDDDLEEDIKVIHHASEIRVVLHRHSSWQVVYLSV